MGDLEVQELQEMTLAELAAFSAEREGIDGMTEFRYTGANGVEVYVVIALGDAAVLVGAILDDELGEPGGEDG